MKIQKKVKFLNLINVHIIWIGVFFNACMCILELSKFCTEYQPVTQRATYSTSCILCLYLSYIYFWSVSHSLFQPLHVWHTLVHWRRNTVPKYICMKKVCDFLMFIAVTNIKVGSFDVYIYIYIYTYIHILYIYIYIYI